MQDNWLDDELMGGVQVGQPRVPEMSAGNAPPVDDSQSFLDADLMAIDEMGGQAPTHQGPVPFRFRDPGDDSFGQRLRDSGQHNAESLMQMTKDPVKTAKMIAGLFSKDGIMAMKDFYVQSYGSIEKARDTAMNDPMGFLGDVSGAGSAVRGIGKVGGMPKVAAAGNLMENLDPLTGGIAAAKAGGANVADKIPSLNPENTYENLLKMPVTPRSKYRNRGTRASVIDTLLRNKISPNPKGVEKLNRLVAEGSNKIDDLIDTAELNGTTIPSYKIYERVMEMQREVVKQRGNPKRNPELNTINNWMRDWEKSLGSKQFFTPNELRELRQGMDKRLNWGATDVVTPPMEKQLGKLSAHGMREALAEGVPEAGPPTKEVSNLLDASEPLERASARLGNNNQSPLGNTIKGAAGLSLGATGAAQGSGIMTVVGAVMAGKAMLWTPQQRAKVAQMIYHNKSLAEPVKRNALRQLMSQTGQKTQQLDEQQNYMQGEYMGPQQ